jgi:peptidoglycan/LPS O-acetylase OafA/YrhL
MPVAPTAGPPAFYPALDGLRAIAMLAVLISHYFPERSNILRAFHWGRFGVLLFFVLSGFLITGLLLRGRDAVASGEATRGSVFRAFMARRILRIAPIYYLVVLIGWAAGYGPIKDYVGWHLTYTGNIAMTYFEAKLAQATHLWSLCVEEQFYLLWPLVVLHVPARRLVWVAAALVLFSFGWEGAGTLRGRTFEETHLVLQGCMDALGLGALLALSMHKNSGVFMSGAMFSFYSALVGAPLFFFAQGFRFQVGLPATEQLAYRLPGDIGMALISTSLVFLATQTGPSFVRRVLELPPLRFIGRISYGIYLYHLFLIAIGRELADRYQIVVPGRGLTMFLLYTAISVLVATFSWYAIEAPINRQKRRFPYPPRSAAPVSTV